MRRPPLVTDGIQMTDGRRRRRRRSRWIGNFGKIWFCFPSSYPLFPLCSSCYVFFNLLLLSVGLQFLGSFRRYAFFLSLPSTTRFLLWRLCFSFSFIFCVHGKFHPHICSPALTQRVYICTDLCRCLLVLLDEIDKYYRAISARWSCLAGMWHSRGGFMNGIIMNYLEILFLAPFLS